MRVSVIITTYNQPGQLEKVLWGYAMQRSLDFELVIADDGSGPATADIIDRVTGLTGLDVLHVWHEDRGFRKTAILNRAILAASGEYLVFSDGDCIPRADFVDAHRRLARPGVFLSGGYLKLPPELSERITAEDIRAGRATRLSWLLAHGWRPGRRALRLLRSPALSTVFDLVTPTRRTWNGHNSSAWREALLTVNGFDLDMAYGGLDRALGERLINAGLRGRQIRYRAPCLHLYHERPYVDGARWARNYEIRARIRRNGEVRAARGITELAPDESVVLRRPAGAPEHREEFVPVAAR